MKIRIELSLKPWADPAEIDRLLQAFLADLRGISGVSYTVQRVHAQEPEAQTTEGGGS